MTVKIVGHKGEYLEGIEPVFASKDTDSGQFFSIVKDGIATNVFWVDHNVYNSATAFIQDNPDHWVSKTPMDYVRSATKAEVATLLGD